MDKLVIALGSTDLVMVPAPAGTALVGCERPTFEGGERQFLARLTSPFWMQDSPVTVAQWSSISGSSADDEAPDHVKLGVTWFEAAAWLAQLEQRAARFIPTGFHFGLPTEMQWEYAMRAGTRNRFGYCERVEELARYATFGTANGSSRVKSRQPNAWGMYDFLGCGLQWCRDTPWSYPDARVILDDPFGRERSDLRIARGSLPLEAAGQVEPGHRLFFEATSAGQMGFRAALVTKSP